MRDTEAVYTVARKVLADLVKHADDLSDPWGDYPEIGEHDWQRVWTRVLTLVHGIAPTQDAYDTAYAHLAERARTAFPTAEQTVAAAEAGVFDERP